MTRKAFIADESGASAAEFGLILPGVVFLVFGGLNLCMMTYAEVNLQSATQWAARYAAVTSNSGGSPTQTTVSNYANAHYKGPGINQTFTYSSTGSCGSSGANGKSVTATGSYKVYYGWGAVTVALSAAACSP
jgi:Flp pilus assembly protein TadG